METFKMSDIEYCVTEDGLSNSIKSAKKWREKIETKAAISDKLSGKTLLHFPKHYCNRINL